MKMKRIDDLHTHTEQDLLNKLFKYISFLRNFVIEVHHALFLHQKLKFEIIVVSLNSRSERWNEKDCGMNQKNVLKNFLSLFVRGQTFLSFLCLGTSKILSLGEFDE